MWINIKHSTSEMSTSLKKCLKPLCLTTNKWLNPLIASAFIAVIVNKYGCNYDLHIIQLPIIFKKEAVYIYSFWILCITAIFRVWIFMHILCKAVPLWFTFYVVFVLLQSSKKYTECNITFCIFFSPCRISAVIF